MGLCTTKWQVLFAFTGGDGPFVYLWDLRFIDGGPVRQYMAATDEVGCLAREPRHGTLLGGGRGGIACWDLETGTYCSAFKGFPKFGDPHLLVGIDRIGFVSRVFTAIPYLRSLTRDVMNHTFKSCPLGPDEWYIFVKFTCGTYYGASQVNCALGAFSCIVGGCIH